MSFASCARLSRIQSILEGRVRAAGVVMVVCKGWEREERGAQPPNGFRCGAKFENAVGLTLLPSNKIAGHPVRPRGERRLPSAGPESSTTVFLGALHHQLSRSPCAGSWPQAWPRVHTAPRACLPPYLVFRLPGVLATGQLVTSPCSVIKSPVHHQHGCVGKLLSQCLWLRSGKTRVPCSPFRPSLL